MVEEEKSTSEPEREALLRWRRRVSAAEGGLRLSLLRRPSPVERIEMLEDFVRFGLWKAGLVDWEGRGGGAERGVSSGAGEAGRRALVEG